MSVADTARAASSALSRLELATGLLFGASAPPYELPDARGRSPVQALEQAILPSLLRAPCLVSFSGGRDSSAVLAVAVRLARREGLPLPIPATNVFGNAPDADESEWQHRVIGQLGVADWVRVNHTDELDIVGPYARRVLGLHGVLWPCNIHFHLPLLEAARGGSLLTGVGGDELFVAAHRPRVASVRSGAVRAQPRDAIRLALAFGPRAVRRAVLARREPVLFPWLRSEAKRRATAAAAAESVAEPRRLRDRLGWWRELRYLKVGTAGLELIARDVGVRIGHPLLEAHVWAAVAAVAAPDGFSGRSDGMRRVFAGVVADEIIGRRSKARFNEVFWTPHARSFAASWDGGGVPDEWVDRSALANHWRGGMPLAQSFILLQAAWLARALRAGDSVEHPVQRITG